MSKTYLIHLNAGNDVNGNPRRYYVQYSETGELLGVFDEGYKGRSAAPRGPDVVELGTIPTCPSFRREMLKMGK